MTDAGREVRLIDLEAGVLASLSSSPDSPTSVPDLEASPPDEDEVAEDEEEAFIHIMSSRVRLRWCEKIVSSIVAFTYGYSRGSFLILVRCAYSARLSIRKPPRAPLSVVKNFLLARPFVIIDTGKGPNIRMIRYIWSCSVIPGKIG